LVAWGRRFTPTPTALITGADSKTRHGMARRCSSSARVSPPMPPPTMRTSADDEGLTGNLRGIAV
jgi:hypothetical protein